MAIVKYIPDPDQPDDLTPEEEARLDAMTDEELTANALSDPDNPPLTDDELDRMAAAYAVKVARQRTRLSQSAFAEAFHINLARLRDLEQGRTRPDSAMLAYLKVIEREPDMVLKSLGPRSAA